MPSHHSPHSSHSSPSPVEATPTETSHPPISFSFSEAMDDAPPEPSPHRVSFGFTENVAPIPATAAFNARSKRSSLYAAQSNADATPAATPYSIRNSSLTPESAERPRTMSPARSSNSANGFRDPFNFQTQTYTLGQTSMKPSSEIGKRRGHRYKHSSVSHQIFLEPVQRAPLRLPASLPVPTIREGWNSMSREQSLRLTWCFCHLFVAAFVQWSSHGSLATTALSHLVFYDAIGAFLCAGVEVLGNFEVWKRSTIRQPFGLERTEVIVGFAMSILLVFMGFDLVSHNAKHLLESSGTHEPHSPHKHTRASAASINIICALTIATTLTSAFMLENHARLARAMRLRVSPSMKSAWSSVLGNPSHLFTLSCSSVLLLMPLVDDAYYTATDCCLSILIAFFMSLLGIKLVTSLGGMLLMSFADSEGVGACLREIEAEEGVVGVEEAKFWQVHYGLCMANVKVRVKKSVGEEGVGRVREVVRSVVGRRLGGEGMWEVSTRVVVE